LSSRWSTGVVPGVGDDAVVGVAGSYQVTFPSLFFGTVHSLSVTASSATIKVQGAIELTFGSLSIQAGNNFVVVDSKVVISGAGADLKGAVEIQNSVLVGSWNFSGSVDIEIAQLLGSYSFWGNVSARNQLALSTSSFESNGFLDLKDVETSDMSGVSSINNLGHLAISHMLEGKVPIMNGHC
jgi:hypothetical protein